MFSISPGKEQRIWDLQEFNYTSRVAQLAPLHGFVAMNYLQFTASYLNWSQKWINSKLLSWGRGFSVFWIFNVFSDFGFLVVASLGHCFGNGKKNFPRGSTQQQRIIRRSNLNLVSFLGYKRGSSGLKAYTHRHFIHVILIPTPTLLRVIRSWALVSGTLKLFIPYPASLLQRFQWNFHFFYQRLFPFPDKKFAPPCLNYWNLDNVQIVTFGYKRR